MQLLNIKPTDDTPGILFDVEKEMYEISGKSMPEDVGFFYQPALDWLDELAKTQIKQFVFTFNMDYFNTASSKLLLDILLRLENMFENGIEVSVHWKHKKTDIDMKEAGEEFADIVTVPIKLIPLE
jgi:hypothetical protein